MALLIPGSKFNLVNLIYQKLYLYSPQNDTQFRIGDHFGGCTYSPSKGLNSSKNRLNSYNTLIWHYIKFFYIKLSDTLFIFKKKISHIIFVT